ncbi:MAG: hypothetical protein LBJ00_08985 [Planctomycetaceae bacterium]|nr:hypothetical protein [Planctomycetaceae bacterium]
MIARHHVSALQSNKAKKATKDHTEATLKFLKLNTQAQQREAVVQGAKPIALPATI